MKKPTNYIGEKILKAEHLSVDEAYLVYRDIADLKNTGVWDSPGWALEMGLYLQTTCTNNAVIVTALLSVAKSFVLMIYKN